MRTSFTSLVGRLAEDRSRRVVRTVATYGVATLATLAPLVGLALAAGEQVCPPSPMYPERPAAIDAAALGPEGTTVTFENAEDEILFVTTLPAWREWAVGDPVRLDENPVRLGDAAELGPDTFFRFGVAVPTPDGCEVVLSAMSYAIATDVAFLVRARMDGDFVRYGPVTFGVIEGPTWSPDGSHLAFAVGTARASGDGLEVRSHPGGRRAAAIDAERLVDAWREAGGTESRRASADADAADAGVADDDLARAFLPNIRSLSWLDDGRRLSFVTDRPSGPPGTVAWTLDLEDDALRPSGP